MFPFKRKGRVAVIEFFGVIGGGIRSPIYGRLLDDVRRNRSVKAVVVDIDSPGGSAVASEYLHNSLSKLAQTKPVVAFIRGTGASGGYMLSCAAQRIVAMPGSLVGSIGVISARPMLQDLLERVGISFSVSKSAPLKDMGAFYRRPTADEESRMQALVDELYDAFVAKVAQARRMAEDEVKTHATGEVFTGRRAREMGLVDDLGDLDTALEIAARLGGVPAQRRPKYIRARRPFRARLFGGMGASLAETVIEETERRLMERVYYQTWG